MKTIFSPVKQSYLAKIGMLLVVVALVTAIISCNGVVQYDLTIDSTAGGVTTPAEGTHTYPVRTVVNLTATPDCGYVFDVWSGDTGQIDDVNAATTTITMSANYSITANFERIPPDHYKFYWTDEGAPYSGADVLLEDQFGTFEATVGYAMDFGNPVEKEHIGVTPRSDLNRHYTLYELETEDFVIRDVEVYNQFQKNVELTVGGPFYLAVPTHKLEPGQEMVECLNHYLVYEVDEADYFEFEPVEGVTLTDQFIPEGEDVTVGGPVLFANPVKKTVVGGAVSAIEDADLHWVLYDIWGGESIKMTIQIDNQFAKNETLPLTYRDVLAVPSQKIAPPTPPLDHFKCYEASGPLVELGGPLDVIDQFHYDDYLTPALGPPMMFCNPVDKVHGTVTTSSNPDNHLTVYWIETITGYWTVTVDNQFNDPAMSQELLVYGPVALAVPTQKLEPGDHGMPKYLDHYLLYDVVEGLNVTATVDLDDQFLPDDPGVTVEVTQPVYFANPAVKGYVDHVGMWDPDEHLLFYRISDNDEYYDPEAPVSVKNQFWPDEAANLYLTPVDQLLAVPSVKVDWAPWEPM
jgi:hypothetical protein